MSGDKMIRKDCPNCKARAGKDPATGELATALHCEEMPARMECRWLKCKNCTAVFDLHSDHFFLPIREGSNG